MLPFSFDLGNEAHGASIRCVLGKACGAYNVAFRNVRADNRFVPGVSGAKRKWRLVLRAAEGCLELNGRVVTRDEVIIATELAVTNAMASGVHLGAYGRPCRLVGLRLEPEFFIDHSRQALTASVSKRTRARLDALGEAAGAGDTAVAFALAQDAAFSLAEDGIVAEGHTLGSESIEHTLTARIARAVFPLLSSLAQKPMLVDIVERVGVSERQALRDILRIQSDFDLLDRGWRPSIVRWRATAAALLLSSPDLSLAEVAKLAGYSSTTAMGRSLREAGLPTPATVRAMLLASPLPSN